MRQKQYETSETPLLTLEDKELMSKKSWKEVLLRNADKIRAQMKALR